MKIPFFSPIIILFIVTLMIKAVLLFSRIQQQTISTITTDTVSILIDTAYAQSESNAENKEHSAPKSSKPKPPKVDKHKKEVKTEGNKLAHIDQPMKSNLNKAELELLKELSKRREKLEKTKHDLLIREKILKTTEDRINQKVSEMKSLQAKLEDLLREKDKRDQGRILSLVKIYENMKPKDAAKIFNDLEMEFLLRVISNMKEVKVAPVIASMDPAKAREISVELAKQKKLE